MFTTNHNLQPMFLTVVGIATNVYRYFTMVTTLLPAKFRFNDMLTIALRNVSRFIGGLLPKTVYAPVKYC